MAVTHGDALSVRGSANRSPCSERTATGSHREVCVQVPEWWVAESTSTHLWSNSRAYARWPCRTKGSLDHYENNGRALVEHQRPSSWTLPTVIQPSAVRHLTDHRGCARLPRRSTVTRDEPLAGGFHAPSTFERQSTQWWSCLSMAEQHPSNWQARS